MTSNTELAKQPEVAAEPKDRDGIGKAVLNSMWGYWLLLLVISMGAAAAIYEIWLKGNL